MFEEPVLTADEVIAELTAAPNIAVPDIGKETPMVHRVAKVRMLWHPVSGRWVFGKPEGISTYIETKQKK